MSTAFRPWLSLRAAHSVVAARALRGSGTAAPVKRAALPATVRWKHTGAAAAAAPAASAEMAAAEAASRSAATHTVAAVATSQTDAAASGRSAATAASSASAAAAQRPVARGVAAPWPNVRRRVTSPPRNAPAVTRGCVRACTCIHRARVLQHVQAGSCLLYTSPSPRD